MPVRQLPPSPNLQHLKNQAHDLRRAHAARGMDAAQRLREFHPRFSKSSDEEIFAAKVALSDVQLAIAREYGFASWPRLKEYVGDPARVRSSARPYHERIEEPAFRRAVELIDRGDAEQLRKLLKEHPRLAQQRVQFEGGNYFHNPGLLEFIAENPVRHSSLPKNVVEIAQIILDAGADQASKDETLMLVATGSVPRECRLQGPLIAMLVRAGADVNGALKPAALHAEFDSVHALIERGATLTLPVAAALGETAAVRRLIGAAGDDDRHLALSMAADNGHAEIVKMLLDAGEDPNRYNPVGHSHTTPLHQAAGAGHLEVVKLLVHRGARLDIKDILWGATPEEWAAHAKHVEIERYLRERRGDG